MPAVSLPPVESPRWHPKSNDIGCTTPPRTLGCPRIVLTRFIEMPQIVIAKAVTIFCAIYSTFKETPEVSLNEFDVESEK